MTGFIVRSSSIIHIPMSEHRCPPARSGQDVFVNYGGSGRLGILEFSFCPPENIPTDPNLSILTRHCNVRFTMFYFVVQYAYILLVHVMFTRVYIFYHKFNKLEDVNSRTVYFQK